MQQLQCTFPLVIKPKKLLKTTWSPVSVIPVFKRASRRKYGLMVVVTLCSRAIAVAQPDTLFSELSQLVKPSRTDTSQRHAFIHLKEVIELAPSRRNPAAESWAWLKMGTSLPRSVSYYAPILGCLNRALTLARQCNDQHQEALVLVARGELYCIQGELKRGEGDYLQAISIQKATHSADIYQTYLQLADVNIYRSDISKALFYVLRALGSKKGNDQVEAYRRLGNIYFAQGQFAKSVEAYQAALALDRQNNPVTVDARPVKKLAQALIKLKRAPEALHLLLNLSPTSFPAGEMATSLMIVNETIGECYAALNRYKRAELFYRKSIEASKSVPDWEARVAHLGISRFYVTTGQYARAGPHLQRLLLAPNGQVPLQVLMEVHWMQFKVDSAAGHYLAALDQFRQHKALSDSIFSETRSRQLSLLQVQYETRKKEQQIALLLANEQREKTTRHSLVVGAILLTALLGVSYNRFRLKQRNNRRLQTQQEEIARQNHSLQKLVDEKEWMLKEIHHRVKNNLQIITSLLRSQSVYLQDGVAIAAIRESQNRVHAMALIHQRLYQSDQLATIAMDDYLTDIVDYLLDSFDRATLTTKQLSLDPVDLDLTLAVPLGLVVNEAVTNSLKYAFNAGQRGTLLVSLSRLDSQTYQLVIEDEGEGLPPGFEVNQSQTLGLSLIRGLSKQIGGRLAISQISGLRISLMFSTAQMAQ